MDINQIKHLNQVEQLLLKNNQSAAQHLHETYQKTQPEANINAYIKGLLSLTRGHYQLAIDAFSSSTQYFSNSAKFHNNMGSAWLGSGQIDEAIKSFNQALELEPNNHLALYNIACAHLNTEGSEKPLINANKLLSIEPNNSQYLCLKADALRVLKKYRKSITCYQQCLSITSDHPGANSNLSVLLASFGEYQTALKHAESAVKNLPENYLVHLNKGLCLAKLERFDDAMDSFAKAFELNPGSAKLSLEIAHIWRISGDLTEASQWYVKAIKINPDLIEAHVGKAQILIEQEQTDLALDLLNRLNTQHSNHQLIQQVLAEALWNHGDVNAALEVLKKINDSYGEDPKNLARSAHMLASAGEMELAMQNYERALSINPNCIPALNGLATKEKKHFSHDHAQRMLRLIKLEALGDGLKARLHSGLAYYYDGHKAWEQAAEHMSEANQLQWKHNSKRNWNYNKKIHQSNFNQIKKAFSKAYFKALPSADNDIQEPVFIVSMPRSGTTLTEQILASHPQALGIGERNFLTQSASAFLMNNDLKQWPSDLNKYLNPELLDLLRKQYLSKLNSLKTREGKNDVIRIVDKMPDNYALIGWIKTLFPKAKIIHIKRHPRAVALSCWMTSFGKIQWASRWPDLLDRINEYQDIISHWHSVLPGQFMEISYESLVANQTEVSKKLIEYIGLEWDEKCLNFYESEQLVKTASISQVRQPMYTKSIQKWQKYIHYLPELVQLDE